jgi:uncharacterized membrane protein HdeD (DUF308 family)
MGVLYIIIGVVAFTLPLYSTLGITITLGAVFVGGGILQLLHSIHFRKHAGNGWRVL